jgi:putative Holliday junction resolvase
LQDAFPEWLRALAEARLSIVTTYRPAESHLQSKNNVVGPILALDIGSRRVGVAISDTNMIAVTRLQRLERSNWKQLLHDVRDLIRRFDAQTLVIGLPLRLDGKEGSAAIAVRETARKFVLSLTMPVYLQDERLSSVEAEERLQATGLRTEDIAGLVDSESAAIILQDFIHTKEQRILVEASQFAP